MLSIPIAGTRLAVALLALGAGVLCIAGYGVYTEHETYASAATADGMVIKLNAGGSHPQIEFTTATGETVSYPQGGVIWGYEVGDHVKVRYFPDDPKFEPRLDTPGAMYPFESFAAFFIVGVWGLALIAYLRRRSVSAPPGRFPLALSP